MNAALSWAGSAANDQEIRYTGVRYDGERHDYEGTVEDFFDTVGEKREWLDWELQRNRLERQAAEVAAEVGLSQVREQQAQVRLEVQALNVQMQELRVQAAEEVLDYASQRMFDEDLWFQLAAQLQDLARDYLDAAIYAAKVMERAYDLEFDRRLNRIRLDYGLGGPAGLLGGEMLKRDIISFTSDYLEHAQKKNPVRLALSLSEEFPSGFAAFVRTGHPALPHRSRVVRSPLSGDLPSEAEEDRAVRRGAGPARRRQRFSHLPWRVLRVASGRRVVGEALAGDARRAHGAVELSVPARHRRLSTI